jgi:deoxyribose-phosphate aldolase
VEAGATRIGASASVKILEQARAATPSETTTSPAGNY